MHTGEMDKRLPAFFPASRGARFRLALILLALACAIAVGKLLEDSLIERLQHDCESLFDDRLVPAATLFHLGDQMYLKHRLLQRYRDEPAKIDAKQVHYEMGQHDAQLAELVERFRQTYLVADESALLQEFDEALREYQRLEQQVMDGKEAGGGKSGAELAAGFARVRQSLLELTEVQQRVGLQLRAESIASAASVTSLLYLQLGVAFVLGLISSGLAMSLGRPPRPRTPRKDLH